jgi:hypothetical protein
MIRLALRTNNLILTDRSMVLPQISGQLLSGPHRRAHIKPKTRCNCALRLPHDNG